MIRTLLAFSYLSYLVFAGGSMAAGMDQAEHASKTPYQSNICRLMSDC